MKRLAELEAELRSAESKIKELEKIKARLEASPLQRREALVACKAEIDSCTKIHRSC